MLLLEETHFGKLSHPGKQTGITRRVSNSKCGGKNIEVYPYTFSNKSKISGKYFGSINHCNISVLAQVQKHSVILK